MAKPKVAIFDFTGCEGCELQILNCEDEFLDILGKIEIVNFREAMSNGKDNYDIALIDGGITTPADVERIKVIRDKAKLLITIGSCSSTGGINCLKNFQSMEEVKKTVYGDNAKHFETIPARPVSSVVKVDFSIPGCPIDKKEFI
ncbi:MAG: NADH:ubiquinone oxidoreductase, partial [Planctomycetota bacterium]